MNQIKISKNLYLCDMNVATEKDKEIETVRQQQHILYCVDISGSMCGELDELRRHLKNHLVSDNINENTVISIIAFSGKNECFVVAESVKMNDLRDVKRIHDSIDKYLQAMCLTAFLPPLQEIGGIIERFNKFSGGEKILYSLVFMTDGYNNDSPYTDVIKELEKLEEKLSSASFIEYGYYADSKSMAEMAEVVGGQKIFAKDFESYKIEFDRILTQKTEERKEVAISEIKTNIAFPFLFSVDGERILLYSTAYKKSVLVPVSTEKLYYFSRVGNEKTTDGESKLKDDRETALYYASYVLSIKGKFFDSENCMNIIGDKHLIDMFQGSFGKQRLNELQGIIKLSAENPDIRFLEGKIEGYTPNDNQYCLMNLIDDLASSDDNRFYPHHKDFNYNYTGAKMVTKQEADISTGEILACPEFVREYSKNGYPLSDLVYNSERANISIRLRIEGKVNLPPNQWNIVSVPSFIWRNYTIVCDGIFNFENLPVTLNDKTMKKLQKKNVRMETDENGISVIDLTSLPIINKKMVKSISAKELSSIEIELIKVQSLVKFLKPLTKKDYSKQLSKFLQHVSGMPVEALAFISSLGISEFNGFSPRVEASETTDSYIACYLKTKVAKFSSVPKIDDVVKKINENKNLTPSESVVKSEMDKFYAVASSAVYEGISEKSKKEIEEKIADTYFFDYNEKRKLLLSEKAKIIFSLIMTRSWFKEFASMDENEISVEVFEGLSTTCKFEFVEDSVAV